MASSPVEVCNVALKRLGQGAIVSLDPGVDVSNAASACAAVFAATRDRLLREYEWGFAQVRRNITPLATAPAFGWDFQYTYPTLPLCLKVNETNPPDAEYDIEVLTDPSTGNIVSTVILTDESSLGVRYTGQIVDVSRWDASFVDCMADDLAAQLAYPLTENAAKSKEYAAKAAQTLQHARTADSQEGSTKRADVDTLTDIRQHGFIDDFRRNGNSL